MDSEIGCYLQQLRMVRRISTAQLALRAGIGRSTLNRWQAGKAQPRLQELEAVLDEMAVSPAERTSALTLLASSVRRNWKDAENFLDHRNLAGLQPHCGDLLRAMRLRKGKTQAEVALYAGTAQATVARWERADVWPDRARLKAVAEALDAPESEFIALSQGPRLASGTSACLEALEAQLDACMKGPQSPAKAADAELHLLRLAADTWPLACHSNAALKLLADIYTIYAERLYYQRRFLECEQTVQQAHEIYFAIGDETDAFWARAVLRGASALAQKGSRRAIERALRQLRFDFPCDAPAPFRGWMMSEMGLLTARKGDLGQAICLGLEALALAEQTGNRSEIAWRQADLTSIYLLAGRPQEAWEAAPLSGAHPAGHLVRAEAALALGRSEEAHRALQAAAEWLDGQTTLSSHCIPYYRAEYQRLLNAL